MSLPRKLPRNLDELRGLRAARWIRESTTGQFDNFGPDAQRAEQDSAIERHALVDTGLTWSVAHSGGTVHKTAEWAEMIARAGRDYDVLVVGYVSRFSRSAEIHYAARRQMHDAGAVVLFADRDLLTSDDARWEEYHEHIGRAEGYRRDLAKNIASGYRARFRRHSDPGGRPPLGFRRTTTRPFVLEVNPETIGQVVALFERYAVGDVSVAGLAAEFGMVPASVNDLLKNRAFNGFVRQKGVTVPAAWRAGPPVSDDLWERVQSILARNVRGGGPRKADRIDPLRGLIFCGCGARVVAHGIVRGRLRRRHLGSCPEWGSQQTYDSRTWEAPIGAQLAGLRLDEETIEAVIAATTESDDPPPVPIDTGRIQRRRRELWRDAEAGRISIAELQAAIDALPDEEPLQRSPEALTREEVEPYLRNLPDLWAKASREGQAALIRAVFDRIVVRGPRFEEVALTAEAYSMGLAIALPEHVEVAGEEGFEPSIP
jgi:hypothetical protein